MIRNLQIQILVGKFGLLKLLPIIQSFKKDFRMFSQQFHLTSCRQPTAIKNEHKVLRKHRNRCVTKKRQRGVYGPIWQLRPEIEVQIFRPKSGFGDSGHSGKLFSAVFRIERCLQVKITSQVWTETFIYVIWVLSSANVSVAGSHLPQGYNVTYNNTLNLWLDTVTIFKKLLFNLFS